MYIEEIPQSAKTEIATLEDFLRASKEGPDAREIQAQWDRRKDRWLESLDELFARVGGWLDQLKTVGQVSYSCDKLLSINEEHIGSYQAPFMTIIFSDKRVVLKPVGTNLIGGVGRVDIFGPNGQRTLVLKDWSLNWNFFSREVSSPTDVRVNYEPLTDKSFKEEMLALIVDQWPL